MSVIEKFEDAKQHILQVSWRKAKSADAISAAVRRAMEELGSSSDMVRLRWDRVGQCQVESNRFSPDIP